MTMISSMLILVNAVGPILHYISKGQLQLPVKMWFPFNENELSVFPYVYLWMVVTSAIMSVFNCGCDLLLFAFLTIISMKFILLGRQLTGIDMKSKDTSHKIIDFVVQHNELMTIVDRLQKIFAAPLFFTFFGSSIAICLSMYETTSSDGDSSQIFKYVMFVVIALLQILALCVFGQKVFDSSLSVANAAYATEWHSTKSFRIRKMISLIIMRSQKAKELSAMSFFGISLESFSMVRNQLDIILVNFY